MPDESKPPEPGTMLFAAEAQQNLVDHIERYKARMTGGQELVSALFGCSYDNATGFCTNMCGNPSDLVSIMAIGILKLAELSYEELQKREKYLAPQDKTPFKKIAAEIAKEVLVTVTHLSHDKDVLKKSPIITPDQP